MVRLWVVLSSISYLLNNPFHNHLLTLWWNTVKALATFIIATELYLSAWCKAVSTYSNKPWNNVFQLTYCIHSTNRWGGGHLWQSIENWAKYDLNMEWYCESLVQRDCQWKGGSHEPGDGPREEILIVKADVARHTRVFLPEDLRHGLELGAHLDEAVQLDAGASALQGVALHQRLRKLGTQVVAHLSEGWGQERDRGIEGKRNKDRKSF